MSEKRKKKRTGLRAFTSHVFKLRIQKEKHEEKEYKKQNKTKPKQ